MEAATEDVGMDAPCPQRSPPAHHPLSIAPCHLRGQRLSPVATCPSPMERVGSPQPRASWGEQEVEGKYLCLRKTMTYFSSLRLQIA